MIRVLSYYLFYRKMCINKRLDGTFMLFVRIINHVIIIIIIIFIIIIINQAENVFNNRLFNLLCTENCPLSQRTPNTVENYSNLIDLVIIDLTLAFLMT